MLCVFVGREIGLRGMGDGDQNPNIIISPVDKSSGVEIMHKKMYIEKNNALFENTNTYEMPNLTAINKNCPVSWGCRIHRLSLCSGVKLSPH